MNNLGTVEIITFRATRREHPYLESILGLIRGTSSGHIALRINFSDPGLFNRYIRNNINIPHRITLDPITKKEIYQIYVSFWPDGSWTPWHHVSTLKPYLFDCEQSANYSALEYDPERAAYFKPLQRVTNSTIPILKMLGNNIVSLPPTIILHTSRLGIAFGDKQAMIENTSIVAAAEDYGKKYTSWRAALVAEQNIEILFPNNAAMLIQHQRLTKIAKARLFHSQKGLRTAMYPNEQISNDEFISRLEPFITFGYPERDTITLPLSTRGSNPGVELEPMLSYINTIATYGNKFPYHVLGNNCARVIFEILWEGCKYSKHVQLQKELVLPWFIRWFNLTITPAFIIRHLVKLHAVICKLQEKANANLESNIPAEIEDKQKSKNVPPLEAKQNVLSFKAANNQVEELPTTRIGIYARLLDDVTQYIRS